MLKFDLPDEQAPIIKVIGVGGGGSNAVSHMFQQGIKGVDFYICNTDAQALNKSNVPNKIKLGSTGLGAGSKPSVGRESAILITDEIRNILSNNTSMLFITAGMGGGTGTGAAPVIAQISRELGILTVGIVTKPFGFEGRKREQQAIAGLEELKKHVDTTLVICNDKLLDMQGDIKLSQAFGKADNVLTIAAKGIAEIITVTGRINVDFEDVKTVMKDSGKAIMGSGIASGPDRALKAVEMAMNSPLLDDTDVRGADNVLLYITSGKNEISLEELNDITGYISSKAGGGTNVIWGDGVDESLDDEISITLIATGFDKPIITIHNLEDSVKNTIQNAPEQPKAETITEVQLIDNQAKTAKTDEPVFHISELTVNQIPETLFTLSTPDFKAEKITFDSIPLEITPQYRPEPENQPVLKFEPVVPPPIDPPARIQEQAQEDIRLDRKDKLKGLSFRPTTPGNIEELEKTPAYQRRNVELPDASQVNENTISRYTLGTDENNPKRSSLREGNSFFHEKPD